MDCCHSGSGTRDIEYTTRGVNEIIFIDSPKEIFYPAPPIVERGMSIPKESRYSGLASHVLLAACRSDQTAREDRITGGLFTNVLLEQLRKAFREGATPMTYTALIQRLPAIRHE